MIQSNSKQSESVKLGDVVSFKTGKLNSNAAMPDGAYLFFTCSPETFKTDSYSFDTECVLLSGNNASGVYNIKYFRGKFDVYQRTYVIRSLDDKCLINHYLYYALQTKLELLKSISTGAATKFLTLTILRDINVELPPLPIQRKIGAILSAYDDMIENNIQRIKILEEMSRAIYHEWFVKFRSPGHKKVRMVDSPLGKIPEGWGVRKLSELSQLTKEKFREDKHSNLPLLDMARMLQHTLLVGEMGYPEELSTSRILFNEDDILFGSIRPYLHKVALAPCQGVTNVSVLVIRPIAEVYKSLLSVLLSSVDTVRWADQHSTGTKMPVIKWDILQSMPVLLPDESILSRFHDIVYPMFQTIKMTCSRNQNLRRTRAMLLPRLISSELDVGELDIETERLDHG